MNYTQIIATNSQTGQIITERYFEDGTRFIKHIPFNPLIFTKLKEQFNGKNVSVEIGENKWIRISKTGENPQLKVAAEQAIGKKEITREEIVKIEADMLRKAGFSINIKEIKDEKSD